MRIQIEDYRGMMLLGRRGHWQVCEMTEGGLKGFLFTVPTKLPERKVLAEFSTKAQAQQYVRSLQA